MFTIVVNLLRTRAHIFPNVALGKIAFKFTYDGSAEKWKNGCGNFISGQNFKKLS